MLKSRRQAFIGQVDPVMSGFIAEHNHRRNDTLSSRQRYESFWFDKNLPVSAIAGNNPQLIALHHSWTPAEYSAMKFEELEGDDSLLSRYLKSLLGGFDKVELNLFKVAINDGVDTNG